MPLVKSHQLNLKNISLSDIKTNGNGGKTIFVNYNKGMFKMQTPVMSMPYNMSCYDKGDYPKYSIDVAFRDLESDHRVQGFHENMNGLQSYILQTGLDNSKAWFQKQHKSLDVLSALFTPIVKRSIDRESGEPDGKYADTIKLKMPFRNGKPNFEVTDFEGNVITDPDMDALFTKESKVQAIVRCGGIWIIGGKFGCTWSIEKVRIESNSAGESEKVVFINDDDESDEASSGEDTSDESSSEEE